MDLIEEARNVTPSFFFCHRTSFYGALAHIATQPIVFLLAVRYARPSACPNRPTCIFFCFCFNKFDV